MACELSQFLLIRFSTLDCGSIHEYPRRHLHLLDSLTYSSFRRKFQITGTDLEPKILVNSRLFLGCPYYTAITSSPSTIPAILKFSSSAAVAEFRHTTLLVWQYSASLFSSSFVLGPVVIQPLLIASATSFISSSEMSGGLNGITLFSIIVLPLPFLLFFIHTRCGLLLYFSFSSTQPRHFYHFHTVSHPFPPHHHQLGVFSTLLCVILGSIDN